MTAVLALVAPGAAPRKGRRLGQPRIHVVVRTRDGLHVGHDLRYKDGTFHLRVGPGEAEVPEAEVVRITFLRQPREDKPGNPLAGLAVRMARRRLGHRGARMFLPEGAFILPDEDPAKVLRWLAPKVQRPELLALLCADLILHCIKRGRPDAALQLLAAAEKRSRLTHRAFIFALMRVAMLLDLGRSEEIGPALSHLEKRYPGHRSDMDDFRRFLKRTRPGLPPAEPPKSRGEL